MTTSLAGLAVSVLAASDKGEKCRRSLETAQAWFQGTIPEIGRASPPDRPARPDRPEILPPARMKRRGFGGIGGRISLLHALAHIEFNAIDLAWDIVARFAAPDLPRAFFDDWVAIAREETQHFQGLEAELAGLGAAYGDLPAHDGLWDAARKTAYDLKARLAVVPMVLEARALDTAPATIARLRQAGETEPIALLEQVLEDEIAHVAAGVRWFDFLCRQDGSDPAASFQGIVRTHFPKGLKAPFNDEARTRAGFPADFYRPLAPKY